MIIATAGHVDHGKTSLVKHLTGVDTDRLEEEKRRGLSIDLGFAYLETPGGQAFGFIDVPGHQRFINTMISGVTGIDLGLLVVAADDGIMPQTCEHLDIMQLLGIHEFIAVVSKTDRVDSARVADVGAAVAELVAEYSDSRVLVFPLSNETGEGIEALQNHLAACRQALHPGSAEGIFRLNIDRVFTLKGLGLMVTGTVVSGTVHSGDTVHLMPAGIPVRIRSLHAQNRAAEKAARGVRCALNITGDADKHSVGKGDWLVGEESGPASASFIAAARILPTPVKQRQGMPVKLYIGARHVEARLRVFRDDPVPKSCQEEKTALVQITADDPVSCCRGDRFLLRDYSENFLLAGGFVLDPFAVKTRKITPAKLCHLEAMAKESFGSAIHQLLITSQAVVDYTAFRQAWNLSTDQASSQLATAGLLESLVFREAGEQYLALSLKRWQAMLASVIQAVRQWHKTHPDQQGIAFEALQENLALAVDERLLPALLTTLQDASAGKYRLVQVSGLVKLASFSPGLSDKALADWQQVEQILVKQGLEIPLLSELEKKTGIRGRDMNYLVSSALKRGQLVRISPKRVGLPATLKALADKIAGLAANHPLFTVIDFRDYIGTGRNYAIEVLDFMDSVGFTERMGNERRILDDSVPDKVFT